MNALTTITATATGARCEDCGSSHAYNLTGLNMTLCRLCGTRRGCSSAFPASGISPVVALGREFVNGLDHPQNVIDYAARAVKDVEATYTEGHDALDAFFATVAPDLPIDEFRARLAGIQTPEFTSAHTTVVWAIRSIAGALPELARRSDEARAHLYLEERAARYGVQVATLTTQR